MAVRGVGVGIAHTYGVQSGYGLLTGSDSLLSRGQAALFVELPPKLEASSLVLIVGLLGARSLGLGHRERGQMHLWQPLGINHPPLGTWLLGVRQPPDCRGSDVSLGWLILIWAVSFESNSLDQPRGTSYFQTRFFTFWVFLAVGLIAQLRLTHSLVL
ncbi:hypothetical protein TorRG33x02_340080 [Trema orientale]|uniref:Uncharacterized protein n=1 Tax=Trema orientale TaxID=63057 RepID=A0A2P5AVI6_TREOI|nr:hypothetical protein TorRG33x02_340080 [Trema orientale]